MYAAGSAASQRVVVPPGSSKRVLFADIADTGSGPHPVVAIDGKTRWIVAGPVVQAGSTADAGVLTITAHPMEHFGATSPAWSADGKRVAFVLAQSAGVYSVGAGPELASKMERSVIGDPAIPASIYDLGPIPGLANQIIYGGAVGDQAIYRTTEGSGKRGERLVTCDAGEALLQAQWLPDGSGFLFAKTDFTKSDIYRYELATRRTAPVTHMSHEYAGAFCVSPDGRSVVFERSATLGESRIDLWTFGWTERG